MATPYSDVYDFFMQQIEDFALLELYEASDEDFETVLQGWMILAINEFVDICDQDLTARNDTTGTFSIDLTDRNKLTLARIMVKFWLEKEVQDVLQMNWNLTDRDFRHYSEAQNLDAKNRYLVEVTERISQLLTDYSFKNVDWTSWANGEFGV